MKSYKWKISVTKVWKSKIRYDSFLVFSVLFGGVYSVFSLANVFIKKFADQYCQFWQFLKKSKMGAFVRRTLTLRNFFVASSLANLFCLSEKFVLAPQTLSGDSVFSEIWQKQNRPFSSFSAKNLTFLPIKIWLKRSFNIAPKLMVLWSKWIKSNLKCTNGGPIQTYLL